MRRLKICWSAHSPICRVGRHAVGSFCQPWSLRVLGVCPAAGPVLLRQDVLASSTACAEEALVASKVVRTFGTEQKEQDRYMTWLE